MKRWSLLLLAAMAVPAAENWEKLPDGSSGQVMELQGADGATLAGYVRKPDGPGPFPMVVMIHGGGNSKQATYTLGRSMKEPAANLVAAGWAIFSLDFRPNSRAMLDPQEIDDGVAAIAQIRALPFVDGSRLALLGGSHGANLISRLASRVDARAGVLCAPAALDLPLIARAERRGEPIVAVLKKLIAEMEQKHGAAAREIARDPAKHRWESAYTEGAKVRFPLLIVNGRNDTSSPVSVVNAYMVRVRVNGRMVEMYLPENGPHGFYFGHPEIPETKEAALRAVSFIRRNFDPPKQGAQPGAAMSKYAQEHPPRESTGMIPLNELRGKYRGEEGGLYPGGGNAPPPKHLQAGLERARSIRPLDAAGKPAPDGKIVLLTVGMSNTTMESQALLKLARGDRELNPKLVLVDGAQNGRVAMVTADAHADYWKVSDERLKAAGVTPRQVQAVWIKQANGQPTGGFPAETKELQWDLLDTVMNLRERYPNLQIAYLSSRIYAGYAATALNPEPYAYEGAFAVKWLIGEQMKGNPELKDAPWLAWGPYLWADGTKPRGDGLIWKREDLGNDGTHPSESGREKVAQLLLTFLKQDPTARPWVLGTSGR